MSESKIPEGELTPEELSELDKITSEHQMTMNDLPEDYSKAQDYLVNAGYSPIEAAEIQAGPQEDLPKELSLEDQAKAAEFEARIREAKARGMPKNEMNQFLKDLGKTAATAYVMSKIINRGNGGSKGSLGNTAANTGVGINRALTTHKTAAQLPQVNPNAMAYKSMRVVTTPSSQIFGGRPTTDAATAIMGVPVIRRDTVSRINSSPEAVGTKGLEYIAPKAAPKISSRATVTEPITPRMRNAIHEETVEAYDLRDQKWSKIENPQYSKTKNGQPIVKGYNKKGHKLSRTLPKAGISRVS